MSYSDQIMDQPELSLAGMRAQVDAWLQARPSSPNEVLIAEMLRTVLRLADDGTSRGDLKILNRSLKELRYAFKVFAPYSAVRKVSIFGSTRVLETDPYYALARELARRITEEGFMVITGAGPGVMQAGHEGAGQDKSFGVNIRLPLPQKANHFILDDPKLVTFRFFFTRKVIFVKEADAFVFFPGGYGTHDELTEALTLAQTGKSQLVPLILMDLPNGGYWRRWQEFLREGMLSRGYISEEELGFFKVISDVEAAVHEIKTFYRNYHSYRFVKRDLVIRLRYPPSAGLIGRLNRDFAGILTGKVRPIQSLSDESDEPSTAHLYRLLVPFDRTSFARLRQMIDVLNRET